MMKPCCMKAVATLQKDNDNLKAEVGNLTSIILDEFGEGVVEMADIIKTLKAERDSLQNFVDWILECEQSAPRQQRKGYPLSIFDAAKTLNHKDETLTEQQEACKRFVLNHKEK